MPFNPERVEPEAPGRVASHGSRANAKVRPRFEVLEPRCLMSATPLSGPSWHSAPLGNPPAASVSRASTHDTSRSPATVGPVQAVLPIQPAARAQGVTTVATGTETLGNSGQTLVGTDSDGNSYVIGPETRSPHQTFATAQSLPNDPYFGVIGTIGGGEPIDLYRLTVSAATAGFQFQLVSSPPASAGSLQFWLFDGSGKVMGEWSSGTGASGSFINFALDNSFSGSSLFVGVSPGNPNGQAGSAAPLGYQLWVQRFNAPTDLATATGAGAILPSIASTLFVGALVGPLSTLSAAASQGDSSALTTTTPTPTSAPSDLTTGFRVSVGSTPTRSAEAAGGLMSEGEDRTVVVHVFTAVDRETTDKLLAESVQGPRTESGSSNRPGGSETEGGLITLRGPGGFPLLGADAIGSWRGNSNARVASWAEDRNQQPDDSPAEGSPVSQEPPIFVNGNMPLADLSAGADAGADAGASRSRDLLWGTLSSGLGTVTLLTLNALFSNPIAGYDVLPSRLDAAGASGSSPFAARRNHASVGFRRWGRVKKEP
jgi:hypothetical protein